MFPLIAALYGLAPADVYPPRQRVGIPDFAADFLGGENGRSREPRPGHIRDALAGKPKPAARRDLLPHRRCCLWRRERPSARKLWEGKVIRSFDRDPRSRERLAEALRRIDWHTQGGVYLGPLVGLEGDLEGIGNVLRKIVRGISYLERDRTVAV
jgi:hypothetical protein